MLYCCLIDDSMKEHWSNTHDFVLTLNHHWGFVFNVLICKTLLFLADSVVIGWWLFEETLMKQRRFCCKTYWALSLLLRSIPKHSQFIAASLMVRWSSNHETLTTSFELLLSTNALFFFLLICEALIFHCCFGDIFLMLLWVNTVETAMICLQTLVICYVSSCLSLINHVSMLFRWWYVYDCLKRYWWTMELSMQTILIRKDSKMQSSKLWGLIASWLFFR